MAVTTRASCLILLVLSLGLILTNLSETAEAGKAVRDQDCVLCEYVITTLEKQLGDNPNAEQVKEALDKICGYLPKTVSAECVNFVDTYSTMIIDLVSHDLPPDQVCSALGLCQQ